MPVLPPALFAAMCAIVLLAFCWMAYRLHCLRRQLDRQSIELREARRQEALGTLAGGIAHDFNNILGAILGFGALLDEDLTTAPEQQEMARQITTAARRGQHIVAQLMSYSRRNMQDNAHGHLPVSLDSVIRESINLLEPCIRRSTRLAYRNTATQDIIETNATQIGQALVNLCLNADQAIGIKTGRIDITLDNTHIDIPCGEDNSITISGGRDTGHTVTLINGRLNKGRYVRIRIEDDGEGMTRDTAERIFDPFFTTKEVGVGTGLGLPALQGIVHAHGGTITVTSTRFRGTAFELLFPLGAEHAA
jgi:signal transduction histidine kinase